MKAVHTVTGPVDPNALGFTQTHEHILCDARRTHRGPGPKGGGTCTSATPNGRWRN